jgi:uncharacterized protein
MHAFSRRTFLGIATTALAHAEEIIIDIHQHTKYHGRTDHILFAHQRNMGISKTVLLPAGSENGDPGGNSTAVAFANAHPERYVFFANAVPDSAEAKSVIEKYLKLGAIGIGEQKYRVACDSVSMQLIAEIAREHGVPVLMHFEHEHYNLDFDRFYRMLEKYPTVNFIGHAQTWWGNIDNKHNQSAMYPKGPVTPGGITDRLPSDYANIYGDLSAGSGLNALLRDEDYARDFLKRHQDKLMYGSDCSDGEGAGPTCSGSQQLTTVRRVAPDPLALRKILYGNAARLLKIG